MIGWYVHHHGSGHAHRAGAVAQALHHLAPEVVVTGLSSAPTPGGWPGRWLQLPRDEDGSGAPEGDPTAGGVLHWAPAGHPGLRERMTAIAAWVQRNTPKLVVVDASVEVTLLLRLLGVAVVVVAAPGERLDRPHRAAYDAALHLLAPWPGWVQPAGWPPEWLVKTTALGALSRYDGRPPSPVMPGTVAVLWGVGGLAVNAARLSAAVAATPRWRWTVLADVQMAAELGVQGARWVPDPWPQLTSAEVVVTHAGQNALAEVAAARRPAIVLPQRRPHAEQQTTGAALATAGLAAVEPTWPGDDRWPVLLDDVAGRDGGKWRAWSAGDGAAVAARTLLSLVGKAAVCAPA